MSKKVYTINGEHLLKSECRKYKENWYKIGNVEIENSGDCYLIGDSYYRIETGSIVYDHSINSYIRNNKYLYEGIISFNNDLTPIYGKFSNDCFSNVVILQNGQAVLIINENILDLNVFEQSINDSKYYHKSIIPLISRFNIPKEISQELKRSYPYNSGDYSGLYESLFQESDFTPTKTIEQISKLMCDYTFGVEFETSSGVIPKKYCEKLGLMPLRDGSIGGLEYATIPLKGAIGLQALYESCSVLNKWTTFNDDCSIHIHIGGVERTPEFITAFFKLSLMIQDSLFELFPVYKQLNKGVKRKNYTAPYPSYPLINKFQNDIKTDFNVILNYLGRDRFLSDPVFEQQYDSDIKYIKYHPHDPENTSKWNIRNRYHFNNLIPLLYTNKQTIEFRLHSPTFEFDKILAFMLINVACIKFANKYKNEIILGKFSTITLIEIIDELSIGNNTPLNIIGKLKTYIYKRIDTLNNEFRNNNIFVNESQINCFIKSYEDGSSLSSKLKNQLYDYINNTNDDSDFLYEEVVESLNEEQRIRTSFTNVSVSSDAHFTTEFLHPSATIFNTNSLVSNSDNVIIQSQVENNSDIIF